MTPRTSTRALLICQASGALGALLLIVVTRFTSRIAVFSPPLYGLAAGMRSILPFFARRVLGFPFAATAVSASVGFLGGTFTPIGLLIMIPLTLSGFSHDLTLLIANRVVPVTPTPRWRYPLAAAASAVVLFVVSLPVMSPAHLTWPVQSATLGARLVGQLAASVVAGLLARRVSRAGIFRPIDTPREERTSTLPPRG